MLWRPTLWVRWNGTALAPDWGSVIGRELYNHSGDDRLGTSFDGSENMNEVAWETNAATVANLTQELMVAFGADSRTST